MNVLSVKQLTKAYQDKLALKEVSMELEAGKIYGFVGRNGAGKTTLIKMITGIAYPTSGSLALFGKEKEHELVHARKRIGMMVEHAGLAPGMTAYENLNFQRKLRGIKDKSCIDEALQIVGLENSKKKFKNFSMGMKGRLGIAAALLSQPDFLILDEPTNGLDPIGIIEIRKMLQLLNQQYGTTILISSHKLDELYQLATDYLIIEQGQLVEQLTSSELEERCQKYLLLNGPKRADIIQVLQTHYPELPVQVQPDHLKLSLGERFIDKSAIAQTFIEAGVLLTEISYQEETLEDYFIHAIGGKQS